jgi:ABC-type sugar transport system ATPase subunit
MYTLKNVYKIYGQTCALEDINCEIPTDKFVVVLGPSGSGKSTLLRQMSFIEIPDRGNVHLELNGRIFCSNKPDRPWPRLTSVFQKQFLWPHLTLRENIELPLRERGSRNIVDKIQKVTDLFDMSSFLDRFPNEVSGGQAQRAALARAFTLNPELILIDEAHGGLDLEQQHILNSQFISLKHSGVGLIVVTHSLDFARRYADHVIVLEKGRMVENGPSSVFKNPSSRFLQLALIQLSQ